MDLPELLCPKRGSGGVPMESQFDRPGDFTNWKNHDAYQEAFDRLISDLRQEPTIDKSLVPDT